MMIAGVIIGIAALAASLLPMFASSGSERVREISLVVRDMTFYVEGEAEPNPTLRVGAGEQVRLVLKNDEAGMRHDFAVNAWQIGTRMLDERGEEDTVTFRAPSAPGDQTYHCTPHSKMMRGTIRVE
jgi:plastocyanin